VANSAGRHRNLPRRRTSLGTSIQSGRMNGQADLFGRGWLCKRAVRCGALKRLAVARFGVAWATETSFDGLTHGATQSRRIEGFTNPRPEPVPTSSSVFGTTMGRQCDHRDGHHSGCLQLLREPVTILARHHDVRDHNVGSNVTCFVEGSPSFGYRIYARPAISKDKRRELERIGVVFDEKYAYASEVGSAEHAGPYLATGRPAVATRKILRRFAASLFGLCLAATEKSYPLPPRPPKLTRAASPVFHMRRRRFVSNG
jgi:hypothetical protein